MCGVGFEEDGYTVGLNIERGEDFLGRLEERFCSEKCGMEFALKIQEVAKAYFMPQEEDGDAS